MIVSCAGYVWDIHMGLCVDPTFVLGRFSTADPTGMMFFSLSSTCLSFMLTIIYSPFYQDSSSENEKKKKKKDKKKKKKKVDE